MARRIIGLEVEYGLIGVREDASLIDDEQLGAALFAPVKRRTGDRDAFLENGGRIYLDVGNHPEYATPECVGAKDAVIWEQAGMEIMRQFVARAQRRLSEEEGLPVALRLLRNNVDAQGQSWGYHENYSVKRDFPFEDMARLLLPFLISRQIIAGTGSLARIPDGSLRYLISQRALHISDGLSGETTQRRPFINDRDETHADPTRWRRLHIIGGDTPMNSYQAWLSLAITTMVIDVIETGAIWREFPITDVAQALRDIALDLTCQQRIDLADGRAASALDIQWAYAERVSQWLDAGHGNLEHKQILSAWIDLLNALERDPMALGDKLDWVLKYQILLQYKQRHGLKLHDARLALIDYHYHSCDPKTGLFYVAQRGNFALDFIDQDEIYHAMLNPPTDTRAALRGRLIRAATHANVDWSAGWAQVKANGVALDLLDPFTAHDLRVDQLIRSFPSA